MAKDQKDNQEPDAQDEADLKKIRDAVAAAEEWDAENPEPQR